MVESKDKHKVVKYNRSSLVTDDAFFAHGEGAKYALPSHSSWGNIIFQNCDASGFLIIRVPNCLTDDHMLCLH